jgi:acyl-CoA thioester hydrolase
MTIKTRQPHKPNAFSIPVRIYYEDTDAGGVVYYANYLKFFERCRSEWLRAIGHDQVDLLRDPGIAFVVRTVNLHYHQPARLDEQLSISLEVEQIGRSQITFRQRIRRANATRLGEFDEWDELTSGVIQLVCVNSVSFKPVSIPPFLRTQLEALQ